MEHRKVSEKENAEKKEPRTQGREYKAKARGTDKETKLEEIKIFCKFFIAQEFMLT